jgi:GNAT superfamily N-acetyltransferase
MQQGRGRDARMTIRAARLEDTPAMARVIVDTYLSAHRGQIPEGAWARRKQEWTYEVSEAAWTRSLREIASGASPRDCIYVALDERGEITGLAMGGLSGEEASGNTGEVYALYVRESHQRRGVGRRLVQAVAAHLVGLGMTALLIPTLPANAPARRFYEALGGQVVGEREGEDYGFMIPEVVYGWTDIQMLVGTGSVRPDDSGP